VQYFHSFLGASVVAPGHTQVLPLPAEFIRPQDGAEKQDCERAAAKRWLARHGVGIARFRPAYLGDDLYACQPIVQAIRESGGGFNPDLQGGLAPDLEVSTPPAKAGGFGSKLRGNPHT
jgi:hypothetical protein